MKKFITEMSQEYEVILFDTPPLNAVTDAQIISRLVGGVVLVARAYQTRKDNLIKAKKSCLNRLMPTSWVLSSME